MNIDTGEIRRLKESLTEEERLFGEGFQEVPKDLEEEAEKILAGRNKAFADMSKKTPLTDWANSMKPGRNNPCPCGSGKKYKKCCGK